jgi:hypothetical protein
MTVSAAGSANGSGTTPVLDEATARKLAHLVGEVGNNGAGTGVGGAEGDADDIVHFYEEYDGTEGNEESRRVVFTEGFQPDAASAAAGEVDDVVLKRENEEDETTRERADMLATLKRLERMDEIAQEEEAALAKAGLNAVSSSAYKVVKAQRFGSGLSKGFFDGKGSRKHKKKPAAANHEVTASPEVHAKAGAVAKAAASSCDVTSGLSAARRVSKDEGCRPLARQKASSKLSDTTASLSFSSPKRKSALRSQNSASQVEKLSRRVSFPSSLELGSGAAYAGPVESSRPVIGKQLKPPVLARRPKNETVPSSWLSSSESSDGDDQLGLLEEVEQAEQIDLGDIVSSDRLDFINEMLIMEAEDEEREINLAREADILTDDEVSFQVDRENCTVVGNEEGKFGTGFISGFLEPGSASGYIPPSVTSDAGKRQRSSGAPPVAPMSSLQTPVMEPIVIERHAPSYTMSEPTFPEYGPLEQSNPTKSHHGAPSVQPSDVVGEIVVERPRRARVARKLKARSVSTLPQPRVQNLPALQGDGRGGLVNDADVVQESEMIVAANEEEVEDDSAPLVSRFKQMQLARHVL